MRALAALLALSAIGCVTVIRPPVDPEDPVRVLLADYGYHSSLIVPLGGGAAMEYAYGQWNWFALNNDRWYNAIPALCWPTQGTLGRRRHEALPIRSALAWEEVLEFKVARARAEAFLARMDERYRKHLETEVFNPVNGLTFVHDDYDYCFLANCNHVLARWLEELGCEVAGCATFSAFRLEER